MFGFTGVADFFSWLLAVILVYGIQWISWGLVFSVVALPAAGVWRWIYRPMLDRIEASEMSEDE